MANTLQDRHHVDATGNCITNEVMSNKETEN